MFGRAMGRVGQMGRMGRAPFAYDHALALDFKQSRYRTPLGYSTNLMAMRGPELVTNGGFDDGLTGWINASDGGGTVTVVDGAAQLSGGATARIRRTITTEIGRTYEFSWAASGDLSVARLHIGNTAGGSEVRGNTSFASGANTLTFVATATTTWLQWYNSGAAANLDNISVREVPVTYTRSGAKAELAATTGLVSFAANEPGIVPDVGYWARGAATNKHTNSNVPTYAGWGGGTGVSLAASSGLLSSTAGRFGGLTAIDGGNTSNGVISDAVSIGSTRTASIFVRGSGTNIGKSVRVGISRAGGTAVESAFSTDAVLTADWQRISVTRTFVTAHSGYYIPVIGGSVNAATEVDVCLPQSVEAAQPGPVIVTTGAAATVGADDMRLPSPITADEDFVMWAVVDGRTASGTTERLVNISDGTNNQRLTLYRGSTGSLSMDAVETLTRTYSASNTQLVAGRYAMLLRRKAGQYSIGAKNSSGTVVISIETAQGFPVGLNRVDIGHQLGSQQPKSPVEFVGIRRGTFTDAECLEILESA